MAHCWGRSEEILVGDKNHIHVWEQGSMASVGRYECIIAVFSFFKIIAASLYSLGF